MLRRSMMTTVLRCAATLVFALTFCSGREARSIQTTGQSQSGTAATNDSEPTTVRGVPLQPAIRVGVLSAAEEPKQNTSQGLYIKILREAGCEAKAISAEQVKRGGLKELDLFIIGGGSGTQFNKSLGEDGGRLVEEFVQQGGGVMASCAGGYSFVLGHNEALGYIEIANARCIDTSNGRWARGKGTVSIKPAADDVSPLKMFYANGPLWEIADNKNMGRIEVLARFETDIHKEGDAGGVMAGTPAIIAGTFGNGRFVLFSAHPEFHKTLGNYPLLADAAQWVTRGPLNAEAKIGWHEVFSTFKPIPQN